MSGKKPSDPGCSAAGPSSLGSLNQNQNRPESDSDSNLADPDLELPRRQLHSNSHSLNGLNVQDASSISDNETSKNDSPEPLGGNYVPAVADNPDSSFIVPSCSSHFQNPPARQSANSESQHGARKQSSLFAGSFRASTDNEHDNYDELAHLEVNKCNIADDSDDSESAKSIHSSFIGGAQLNTDPVMLSYSRMNNHPVNQNLGSTQSNALKCDLNNREHNKVLSNSVLSRSIRNMGMLNHSNPIPIRNTCQMHRSSISSNDLMSSSNYSPGHRMLHSYNAAQSSHCCHNHFRHHHHYNDNNQRVDSLIPVSTQRQPLHCMANQRNPFDLGMSSIEATTIISSHCNTENNTNAPNSAAITTLTASSSSGLPVAALTSMESPKLSSSNNGSCNWQTLMSTLRDRMATIFNSELLADVHFNVGRGDNKRRFPGHILVLSIGSAVFDRMFNGPLTKANLDFQRQLTSSESQQTKHLDPDIDLPDIEPEAFLALLRYLYLDEIDIGPETVMTTLYTAKKYEVPGLELACVDFLKANLSSENAFMLLTQARLFDESNLANLCMDTIDKYTLDSLKSDCFLDIDLDTLKLVLKRDSLRVREVSLFVAAMRWAEYECRRLFLETSAENKRKVLSDALYLIRFPLMSIDEFALNVAQSELLTDREVVNLFLYFTVSFKPSLPFSLEPRCCITGEEYCVNRFPRTESRWGYSGTSDRIRFLTDRPIFVTGFGLFGSIHGPSEYEVLIEIIHTGTGKVLASNNATFVSPENARPDSTYKILFRTPVPISANINYTACGTIKGVDSYYGTSGSRTVTVNVGKGESKDMVTFQFSYAAGCNNGTSVEDGQLPEIYWSLL